MARRNDRSFLTVLLVVATAAAGLGLHQLFPRGSAESTRSPADSAAEERLMADAASRLRNSPLDFYPLADVPLLASDDVIAAIAERFRLRTKYPPKVPISHMLHAARLWRSRCYSVAMDFPPDDRIGRDFRIVSTQEMHPVMFDHEFYDEFYLKSSGMPDLLRKTQYGLEIHLADGPGAPGGEAHVDQLLQVAAEIGLTLDSPIRSPQGPCTIRDVIVHSMMHFSIHQELEFSATAYSRFLPPFRTWTNRFGQTFDFDQLVAALASRDRGTGCCYGAHVPYALINIVRADQVQPILGEQSRLALKRYFVDVSNRLEEMQSSEGWWDEDWGDAPPPDDRDSPLQRRLRTTGHQLEWMALAPAGLRPSDAALSRAANYLAGQLAEMPLSHSQVFYPPLTHSVRSLLLLK